MKNYKAVVIDGRRAIRGGIAVIAALVMTVAVLNIETENRIKNKESAVQNIIGESIPVFSAMQERENNGGNLSLWRRLVAAFFTFDPYDKTTIIADEIPLVGVVERGFLAVKARGDAVAVYNPQNADLGEGSPEPNAVEEGQYPIKAVDSGQKKALGKSKAKILIRNETDYSIDIEEMLGGELSFNLKGDGPEILIVHTHATECYTEEGVTAYSADKSDRSLDVDKNVVAVGERIKQVFEENGIEVIHDQTLHDHPNFNGSYANSLKTVEGYLAKYPSIKIVLDVHRDAYVYDDGAKAKFVTEINNEGAAQLMFVVGTNAGGLEHNQWRENMKLALKLQKHISDKYPTLMRGVNLRKERFNGHTTTGSLIIEVGSSGNTLNEALRGAECAAREIAEFLKS